MPAQATVKLYASLADYLPAGAKNNAIKIKLADDSTISQALTNLHVPRQHCHLVLVNGIFIPPSTRDSHPLGDGDTLAVWPPVAGG